MGITKRRFEDERFKDISLGSKKISLHDEWQKGHFESMTPLMITWHNRSFEPTVLLQVAWYKRSANRDTSGT